MPTDIVGSGSFGSVYEFKTIKEPKDKPSLSDFIKSFFSTEYQHAPADKQKYEFKEDKTGFDDAKRRVVKIEKINLNKHFDRWPIYANELAKKIDYNHAKEIVIDYDNEETYSISRFFQGKELYTLTAKNQEFIRECKKLTEEYNIKNREQSYDEAQAIKQQLNQLITEHKEKINAKHLQIAKSIADNLLKIHKAKVIHRDLKPANIIIKETDVVKETEAKIFDWNLSKAAGTVRSSEDSGTTEYFAPETDSSNITSEASDVFSFGVILLHLFLGDRFISKEEEEACERFLNKPNKGDGERYFNFITRQPNYKEACSPNLYLSDLKPIQNFRIQQLIKKMTYIDPAERITMPNVIRELDSIISDPYFTK